MPDHRYLSIGEVLGLLLEDFPDVTISKIRFLESQGLIEPERTPSGYRKFYDHDVDLLRAILHEQRENFLPLKVIRDRIESGGIQADPTGARTPPRGIRNVVPVAEEAAPSGERDSVFRRTDGGPEWASGQVFTPGDLASGQDLASPVTSAVPVIPAVPAPASVPVAASPPEVVAALIELPIEVSAKIAEVVLADVVVPDVVVAEVVAAEVVRAPRRAGDRGLPYDRDELCSAAGITSEQLADMEAFGLVVGRGAGRDVTYPAESLPIATVAARFMANGIEARHLRTWRQAADREAALFEQRIMPLLRQRNPQSRQTALDTLTELAELGGLLRTALLESILRHHFEGS